MFARNNEFSLLKAFSPPENSEDFTEAGFRGWKVSKILFGQPRGGSEKVVGEV